MAIPAQRYESAVVLTRLLQAAMIIQIAIAFICGSVCLVEFVTHNNVVLSDSVFAIYTGLAKILTYSPWPIVLALAFWTYRVNRNSHGLTPYPMQFTPGWAVGWWFIPFASLWQPYRVVSELYNVNHDPSGWRGRKPPIIVTVWWICNLVNLVGSVILNLATRHLDIPVIFNALVLYSLALHQALAAIIYGRIAGSQVRAHASGGIEHVF